MNTKYRSIQIQSACIVLLLSLPLWSQDNFKPVPESLLIPQNQLVTIFLTNSVSLENFLVVQTGDVWILKSTNLKTQEFPAREIFRVVKNGIDISDQYPSIGGLDQPSAYSPPVDLAIKVGIGAVLAGVGWLVIGTGLGY